MYSGQEHINHIIMYTGSKYNVMGTDTREVLYRRMKAAGCLPPKVEPSDKLFRFGRNNVCRAKQLIKFDLILNGKPTPTEVHVVAGPLPFILGKQWLKDNAVIIDLLNQKMKIHGNWIKTVDTGSGHEGLTWSKETHSTKNTVYRSTKVTRNELDDLDDSEEDDPVCETIPDWSSKDKDEMKNPDWVTSDEIEMRRSTTPGQGDTDGSEQRTSEEDSDWTSIEEDKLEPRTTFDPEWRTSDEEDSDWTSIDQDKPEQRTTSEE